MNAIGRSWGLPPRAIRWKYRAIVRPVITYGCVVWWCALDKSFQRNILDKVQRTTSLSITGARKSCPQAALDAMLCLTHFDLYVKHCAARSAIRLKKSGCLKQRSIGHSRTLNVVFPDRRRRYALSGKPTDYILPEAIFLPGSRMCLFSHFLLSFDGPKWE